MTIRTHLTLTVLLSASVIGGWVQSVHAQCVGPTECCVHDPAQVHGRERIRLGMRVQRVQAIAEQDGTWTGEITFVTRWPVGGLRPELGFRNSAGDAVINVDETHIVGGQCFHEMRVHGSFDNWFRLRRFPFDTQLLRILLEERSLTDEQAVWESDLWPNILSIDAYRELSAWKFDAYPRLEVKRSSFSAAHGVLRPRLLIVSIPVARLSQFYLTRYFFPLLLIVALAYCLFWIKPEDLGTSASLGITCMLAIIAFQFTQSGSLPHVAYLTLADLVYAVCYVATATAIFFAVAESFLATHDRLPLAQKMDRRGRIWFPAAFLVAIALTVFFGWRSHVDDPDADIPQRLHALAPPPGEQAP